MKHFILPVVLFFSCQACKKSGNAKEFSHSLPNSSVLSIQPSDTVPDIYLELSPAFFKKKPGKARLTIVNRSQKTCIIGYEYSIERKKGHSWKAVPLRDASFNEIGLCINPMSSMDMSIDLANVKGIYEKGAYRIAKNMRLKSEKGYSDTICHCNFYLK